MAFVIKPLRHEDLDQIYPVGEEEQIGKIAYAKRDWPQDMHGHTWAIDEQTRTFLLQLPATREGLFWRYLFGFDGGVALLRKERYCLYSFMYVSPKLMTQIDEVKSLIREVFKMAGEFIDGTTDESDTAAVPNAQFTSN